MEFKYLICSCSINEEVNYEHKKTEQFNPKGSINKESNSPKIKKKILKKNYSTGMIEKDISQKDLDRMSLQKRTSSDNINLTKSAEIKKPQNLYQILIMFNDLIWNNVEQIPNEDL